MKLEGQITERCSQDMGMCPGARTRCLLFCAIRSFRLAVSSLSSDVLSTLSSYVLSTLCLVMSYPLSV